MTNSPPKPELQDEDIDLYYFESDHLALKGNVEYSELLKTIFILEAQRKRAIDDYNKVVELQKQAEKAPLAVMEKLKNGESLDIPDLQHIVEVPKINWSKFNVSIPESCFKAINADMKDDISMAKTDDLKHINSSNTHSKPWTMEEQKRLEELLTIYPPEDVELRRFKKVAAALGTRTVRQVSSRVQKYFLKLRKAGLPIPGRIPRINEKKRIHKHQRHQYLLKPSTFFPHLDIPVVMNEDEDVPGPSQTSKSSDTTTYESHSSNYLLSSNYHDEKKVERRKNELDLQINILKSVRNEKQRESECSGLLYQHIGFRCDYCKEEPIKGSRWQCITCKSKSIDFCTDCVLSQMYSGGRHPLSHKFLIIRDDESTVAPSSDSSCESESGSMVGSSNRNFETSDFNSEGYPEDPEENCDAKLARPPNLDDALSESVSSKRPVKRASNFSVSTDMDFQVTSESFVAGNCEIDGVKSEPKDEHLDGFSVNNKFTETQNVSYNYLHSKLFLDES